MMLLRVLRFFRVIAITCTLLAGSVGAQTCIDPPLGMLGWWPGDGDSLDLHSGLHAVARNGARYNPGLVGEAFSFDAVANGQDDRVDLPAGALDGLSDFTIEMWVLSVARQGAILSAASANVPGQFTDNETLLFQGLDGTFVFLRQQHMGALPVFVNDGGWHHLALTRSGDVGSFYVDGAIIASRRVATEPLQVGPGGLVLGQEQDCLGGCYDPAQAFGGLVDELAIYHRALTEAEVLAIFTAREAGKCKPSPTDALLVGARLVEVEKLLSEQQRLVERIAELKGALGSLKDERVHARLQRERECKHHRKRGHNRHSRRHSQERD